MQHFLIPVTIWKIWLCSPVMFFATEFMGVLGQFLFFSSNPRSFPIHLSPFSSRSLGQFWGRHWNLWVQDWLKDLSQGFGRVSKLKRTMGIFIISGIVHELMVNLPYWIIYRKSYFGTMMVYFLIQGLALFFEKKFMGNTPAIVSKIYTYSVIILPSPLFINVPILKFLGIVYG